MGSSGNNNIKQTPIPVVPRTMRIVNPDGTLTRSGQLLLEQIQTQIISDVTPEEPPDAVGPVTGFTVVHEVGVRYADRDKDRLQHMTVGFVPIVPTPQTVTYLISADDGATWVWIGSQRMREPGQELHVDRLAPGVDSFWRVAAIAGNQGGDPYPILNADLDTLYPGVVRSENFPVAGLFIPPASQGITATIGSCTNVLSADGFTQFGVIPGVVYTDPIGSKDFFVRLTVQNLDAAFAALTAEQAHGGTQITGGSHKEPALQVTYIPGLAYMRYRFYTANRNSQGEGDFSDSSTNTLQMVKFNLNPVLANHYDVPITIPGFTPIDPDDTFNVLSVTGREVGPKYQDEKAGLHTVVGLKPVLDVDFTNPHTVTLWLDFGSGTKVWQGWYSMSFAGQEIKIGEQTLGSDGTRKSGTIWVPANATQGNWKVWCAPGRIDKGVDPTGYPTNTFSVTPVGPCSPNGITNCHFLPDPDTGDPISYYKNDLGMWYWEYFRLEFTPPTQLLEPDFWFALITIQKGATIGGVWTPAPDLEGANIDPYLNFLGRKHVEVMTIAGLALDQTVIMQHKGAYPASWGIPPEQNKDGTPYLYREFRFLIYSVSRLGTDSSGSGGEGTYTLQTSCWPGGKSFFILTPVPKKGDLDLRYTNPATITGPLSGGNGQVITILPDAITGTYLKDDAVQARHMAVDSIRAADLSVAANAIVDRNVFDVGVAKLISGTNIFTGDVILSRGSSKPVIILQNSGINLFGVSDPAATPPGAAGLTAQPNVAIQSGGISLFAGSTSKSVTVTSSAITFWSENGNLLKPYSTVSAGGIVMSDGGSNTFTLAPGGFTIQEAGGVQVTISSGVLQFIKPRATPAVDGNTLAKLDVGGLLFSTGIPGNPNYTALVMDANGIKVSKGGLTGPTVAITATAVTIDQGSFASYNADYTVNINNTTGIKITSTVNSTYFQVQSVSSFAGGSVVAAVSDPTGSYGVNIRTVIIASPAATFGQLQLTGTGTGTSLGTGATVTIFAGKKAGGTPPASTSGYISAQVDGVDVRIPYY